MKTVIICCAATMTLLAGCASLLADSYNYNLSVRNTGTNSLWCSLVASSGGMAHEPGVLVPGKGKTFAGPFKVSYADNWTVAWKTAKGETYEKTLNLTDKFAKPFEGRLIFIIDASNNLSYLTEQFARK